MHTRSRCLAGAIALGAVAMAPHAHAAELTIPYSFGAGTPALASEVNANFAAVKTEVDAKDARIAALESQLASLTARLVAIENSSVMAIAPYVSLSSIVDPNNGTSYPTVRVSNANLQVRAGSAGRGNLIVGDNVTSTSNLNPEKCSLGEYANGPDCVFNGGVWSRNHRSGRHNLVVGNYNSYSATGGFVAGKYNVTSRNYASVGGGSGNIASGESAAVSGGHRNNATGDNSVVSGGYRNLAEGVRATVSGGDTNLASGYIAWIGGGYLNVASGLTATVSGGINNEASGSRAAIAGGDRNIASGDWSMIAGGVNNTVSGQYSSIGGGRDDTLASSYAWRAGDLVEFD